MDAILEESSASSICSEDLECKWEILHVHFHNTRSSIELLGYEEYSLVIILNRFAMATLL